MKVKINVKVKVSPVFNNKRRGIAVVGASSRLTGHCALGSPVPSDASLPP